LVRRATQFKILIVRPTAVFRMVVILAKALAVGGVSASALVHLASFTGLITVLSGRLFAVAVLAVFPLAGFAILLLLRFGRTYRVWGNNQLTFVIQRAPKVLRLLTPTVFAYALICFAVSHFVPSPGIDVSLADSAFIACFYLVFSAIFSVSLGDPRIVRPRPGGAEQRAPTPLE
jgi:hypothetical protein